jgi:Mn-containing catalase
MSELKELLIQEMQDILHAETQLTKALPKMAEAARNLKLREAFEKHLAQTQGHIERLKTAFELLGDKAQATPCKAMEGLVAEGSERIVDGREMRDVSADLALIAAARKVEHYEIAGYGTLRTLARQIGELEVWALLTQTLGEEETADFLLSELAKPIMQTGASQAYEAKTGRTRTANV